MSRQSYENYGRGAAHTNTTVAAGRYVQQAESERLISLDVTTKLELKPTDDLLEIGCGAGNLLIPLSFRCRSATGIDHPALLNRMTERFPGPPTVKAIPGNFLDLSLKASYTKILMYAMLHYLSSIDEVLAFVDKAARLLRPGGRMLLGDLPNSDHKARFLSTRTGKAFDAEWRAIRVAASSPGADFSWEGDPQLVASFNDESILRIVLAMRRARFESYIVPQSTNLPFGHSREDVLIVAAEE